MKVLVKRLESLLKLGGIKKDIIFLIISGAAVLLSLLDVRPFPFVMAWIAIILCGIPIIFRGDYWSGHLLRYKGGCAGIIGSDCLCCDW